MQSFNSLIKSPRPVLVDFYAEWCGPCKSMAPILKEVKAKLGEEAIIIKINVDKNKEAAAAYKIASIPTLLLFKNGRVVWKQSGVVPANELLLIIKQYK